VVRRVIGPVPVLKHPRWKRDDRWEEVCVGMGVCVLAEVVKEEEWKEMECNNALLSVTTVKERDTGPRIVPSQTQEDRKISQECTIAEPKDFISEHY
jgi:hypothetical protein